MTTPKEIVTFCNDVASLPSIDALDPPAIVMALQYLLNKYIGTCAEELEKVVLPPRTRQS